MQVIVIIGPTKLEPLRSQQVPDPLDRRDEVPLPVRANDRVCHPALDDFAS
jgi:hypothetical protein